ncbi:MAG: extracellular solute-binding protein [Caldilinea sp. CFX5]|nr:extracellular solute-binding protein [Caldilinea sp. CFX5]
MEKKHKLSRRWFLQSTALGIVGTALAACAPVQSPQATGQQGGTAAQAEAHITMAAGGVPAPYGPAFERQARRFEEKWNQEKEQKVVVETILDPDWTAYHHTKVPTLVAAGTPPDISWNSGEFVGPYVAKGDWVMVLDDYIERDRTIVDIEKDFPPIVKQASMYKGHYICFAEAGMVYQVTLFNKEFLDSNNMAWPDKLYQEGKWTWETLDQMARDLAKQDANGKPIQFGATTAPYTSVWGFQSRLWSNGADIYSDDESDCVLDSEEGYKQTEVVLKAICEDRVAPRAEDKDIDWLASNKLGISFGWPTAIASWQAKYQFEFDVAPFPAGPQGWQASASFDGWQIAKATKDPEVAWNYVLFAVGPEEDMTRSLDWTRPPNHLANFETWAADLLKQGRIKNIDYLRESMLNARLAHVMIPERPEFSTAYTNLFRSPIESCLTTGKEAVDALAAEIRRLISERPAA